jgi:5'-nucleotidase
VPEIDFVLGGHDHVFVYEPYENNLVLKSGTDFREFTLNKIKLYNKVNHTIEELKKLENINEKNIYITNDKYIINVKTELIQIVKEIEEDEVILKHWKDIEVTIEEKFKQIIGYLHNSVDARFDVVRCMNTSISNFIADLMRIYMDTDIAILNSGSLRIDSVINEGEIRYR